MNMVSWNMKTVTEAKNEVCIIMLRSSLPVCYFHILADLVVYYPPFQIMEKHLNASCKCMQNELRSGLLDKKYMCSDLHYYWISVKNLQVYMQSHSMDTFVRSNPPTN